METKARPLISVIIPVYNAELYLERCICSVIAQTYAHFELLLIDDGSTDASGKICEHWKEKDLRIHVFHQQNEGQSSARNLGLDHMSGEYLTFIDADDYVSPNYLLYLWKLSDEQTDVITVCNHYIIRGKRKKENVKAKKEHITFSREEAFEEVLFHGNLDVAPWGKLYPKKIFNQLRYPLGRIFEDTWVFGDILLSINHVIWGERCCYYYEIHEQSTVHSGFTEKKLQYIEAAKKLSADALNCSIHLQVGGVRRINHARLSVLRYMERCDSGYKSIRKQIRSSVLKEAPVYLNHPKTPWRDKIAVTLLRFGFIPFYLGWKLYGALR